MEEGAPRGRDWWGRGVVDLPARMPTPKPKPHPKPQPKPVLASGLAAAMRADAEAARVVRPDGIWSRESVDARRTRIHAALGTESVDASGLSGNHVMRFLMAGWRKEHDHAARLIALNPPDPSSTAAGPIPLVPPPIAAPERPYRGECLAPGCHKEVRRAGDPFCGSPDCREWAVSARRARAQQRAYDLYHRDPKAANQLRVAQRRRKRVRDRLQSRTHLRRCFVNNHPFKITDARRATCGDPAHKIAHQRDRWRRARARYYDRHLRVARRSSRRAKRYAPRAHFILTELMA
jgi:hypothetical protein